jgi:hypothetical protein
MLQNKICFLLFIFTSPKPFEIFQKDFAAKSHYQLFQYV